LGPWSAFGFFGVEASRGATTMLGRRSLIAFGRSGTGGPSGLTDWKRLPPSGKRETLRGVPRNKGHRLRKAGPSGPIGNGQSLAAKRQTLRGGPQRHGQPPARDRTAPSGDERRNNGISALWKHPALGPDGKTRRARHCGTDANLRDRRRETMAFGATAGRRSSERCSSSPTTPRPSGH
jgi:hypothetical protein